MRASATEQTEPGYVLGTSVPVVASPVVIGVPAPVYPGYAVRPVYLLAPSAKIIHIERDDD